MRRLTFILFSSLLMTGLSAWAQNKATIAFNALYYDYGKINEDDGIKSGKFEFKNNGTDTLRISNVVSGNASVTCNWTKSPVPPKGAGYVEAKFDPKARPGNLQQIISVYSNDPDQPKVNLTVKADVAVHIKSITEEYPFPIGNLRFTSSQVAFQNINNTETKTDTLKLYNDWGRDMNLSFSTLPEYMKCKAVPENLKSKQKGYVLVTYDAAKRNDFGYINDRFSITTNDTVQADKSISVSANIVEDFTKMTAQQKKDAAAIKFETLTYNFDTITEGKDIEYNFKFTNTGKDDLFIRKVKGS